MHWSYTRFSGNRKRAVPGSYIIHPLFRLPNNLQGKYHPLGQFGSAWPHFVQGFTFIALRTIQTIAETILKTFVINITSVTLWHITYVPLVYYLSQLVTNHIHSILKNYCYVPSTPFKHQSQQFNKKWLNSGNHRKQVPLTNDFYHLLYHHNRHTK